MVSEPANLLLHFTKHGFDLGPPSIEFNDCGWRKRQIRGYQDAGDAIPFNQNESHLLVVFHSPQQIKAVVLNILFLAVCGNLGLLEFDAGIIS